MKKKTGLFNFYVILGLFLHLFIITVRAKNNRNNQNSNCIIVEYRKEILH